MIDEKRNPHTTDVCENCFGTGTKLDPVKGAIPCPCQQRERKKKLSAAARIPRRYVDCSFDNFKSTPGTSLDNAVLFARSLVTEYPAVNRGLLFMGPAGVGKTHLAVSIIRGLIDKGFACVFSEFGSLLKEIQDSYMIQSRRNECWLGLSGRRAGLDELSTTVPTDWVLTRCIKSSTSVTAMQAHNIYHQLSR